MVAIKILVVIIGGTWARKDWEPLIYSNATTYLRRKNV